MKPIKLGTFTGRFSRFEFAGKNLKVVSKDSIVGREPEYVGLFRLYFHKDTNKKQSFPRSQLF